VVGPFGMNKSTSRSAQAQTVRKMSGRSVIRSEYVIVALSNNQFLAISN